MRFGITAFATEHSLDPGSLAVEAERAGFELLLFPDHTHVPVGRRTPFPGGGEMPDHYRRIFDPFVACAFAAAATHGLRVGVGVALVAVRDPIALAKEVASIDVLSLGRFVLGVGAGWNREEIESHGVRADRRWDVMREHVLAMQAIWSSETASFRGEHVSFGPLYSWPKPLQTPWPPIMVGGHGPRVLERVIEYGDEWLAMPSPGSPPLAERHRRLRELAEQAGRDAPRVSVQLYGPDPPERIIERYVAAGVDRIDLGLPHAGPEQQREHIGRLGALVTAWSSASR